MAELLAPPALVLRRRRTLESLALDPALELGAGGEARVLALPGDGTLVAKLYHHPTIARARKLALMMEDPPALDAAIATLAWPADLLLDGRGTFAGFLMPRAEGPRLFEFYNPVARRKTAPLCHHGVLHRAGANLAAAFDALHARGYVVGDVNESNVLIGEGGAVTLVDADSFQVRDPDDGSVHRSGVGKPEFTPPELQGRPFADFDRSPEHDRFGLAVLLFLLLMEGTHPFAGRLRSGGEAPPVEERIRRGLFPHHGHDAILPPRMAPRYSLLHPALRALFTRAFVDGHADPSARPAAAEWREALDAARERLVACDHNPLHRHGLHLDACPWCERTSLLGGRDPFPAHLFAVLPQRADGGEDEEDGTISPLGMIRFAPPAVALSAAAHAPAASAFGAAPPAPAADHRPPLVQSLVTPLPWIFPLLWVVAFAPTGVVQVAAFVAFVYAVVRAFRRGIGRLHAGSVAAILLLLIAAMLVTGISGEPAYVAEPYVEEDFGPPPTAILPARAELGRPHTDDVVDAAPRVVNVHAVETILADRLPPALRERGGGGGLTLDVYVLTDGTVDPASIFTRSSTHPDLAPAAVDAARAMRFEPLTIAGVPTPAWVRLDVTITR